MADGDLGAAVDTLEFENADITWPHIVHVTGDIFAICFRDAGGAGKIVTVEITAAGEIGAAVEDSFEFAAAAIDHPTIAHVAGEVFAIAYTGAGASGFCVTITINAAGEIAAVGGGLLEFETDSCYEPHIIKVPDADDVFAIVCRGDANQGIINTIRITDAGAITAISMKEAWAANANQPSIIHVGLDVFVIVYRDNLWKGQVCTVDISITGTIGDAVLSTLEYDGAFAGDPSIAFVRDDIYAIVYRGGGDDGFIVTITINAAGTIAAVGGAAGLVEFEEDKCTWPCILHLGSGVCVIAYCGEADGGYLCSLRVAASGQITLLDSLEYDPSKGQHPVMIQVSLNQYAVAYIGTFFDGFLATPTVETPVVKAARHLMLLGIG